MSKNRKLYQRADWQRELSHGETKYGPESYRNEARRDYARLIHCPSFRRLQGKTQLFPSHESDFFRNRLTHSLEVAQVAKSIAIRLNATEPFLKSNQINTDLVELAALAHDMGHPPFGHNGEAALDRLMLNNGGYEGNAQTLRLLARLEKKCTDLFPASSSDPSPVDLSRGTDLRKGLNWSYRSLAAILKYDNVIPSTESARKTASNERHPVKGFYGTEVDIVKKIKDHVGFEEGKKFKTVECAIMDVADDIAYSTYDIEDSFKAGFLSPLRMISMSDAFKLRVVEKVKAGLEKNYDDLSSTERAFSVGDVNEILGDLFKDIFKPDDASMERLIRGVTAEDAAFLLSAQTADRSHELGRNGYLRTSFTSSLVGKFIRNIEFKPNDVIPALSTVRLNISTFKIVETLKHFSFELLIESPMLKISEKRGTEIINKIFDIFSNDVSLMPEDWRQMSIAIDDAKWRSRVICDYIAGMTDRYCVEMYSRLTSENPISIWKPH